jgi:hypothetical protein
MAHSGSQKAIGLDRQSVSPLGESVRPVSGGWNATETRPVKSPMPTLDWIGKDAVIRCHKEVPSGLLEPDAKLSHGDPSDDNLIVQGDNPTRSRGPAAGQRGLQTNPLRD